MKFETHPVKVRKKVDGKVVGSVEVGTANYKVYDSVGEAIDDLGEAQTLSLLNAQCRTNELNRVRGENRPGGMSKTALRNKAIAEMTPADWAEVAGDAAKIEAKLAEKMVAIQAAAPDGGDTDGDEDNN